MESIQLKWLEWAKRIQAISQAGLAYSKDIFDIERFEQLRTLSLEILNEYTEVEVSKLRSLFANEEGYATPKVSIRGVVFQDGKILLVQEVADGKWSLPGGWADIGLSPNEVVVKEMKEETGYSVKPVRLLGVFDKKFHQHQPSAFHEYMIYILCEIVDGEATTGIETSGVDFFDENRLPELSKSRTTEEQIRIAFKFYRDPNRNALCE